MSFSSRAVSISTKVALPSSVTSVRVGSALPSVVVHLPIAGCHTLIEQNVRHCHVRGIYLAMARGSSVPMSIIQQVRANVAEPNWIKNRLYLVNVTMPAHLAAPSGC